MVDDTRISYFVCCFTHNSRGVQLCAVVLYIILFYCVGIEVTWVHRYSFTCWKRLKMCRLLTCLMS